MTEVKLFVGAPDKIERAFNRWANDGLARQLVTIVPLHCEGGDVGFMMIFNTAEQTTPSKIVPVSGMVN